LELVDLLIKLLVHVFPQLEFVLCLLGLLREVVDLLQLLVNNSLELLLLIDVLILHGLFIIKLLLLLFDCLFVFLFKVFNLPFPLFGSILIVLFSLLFQGIDL